MDVAIPSHSVRAFCASLGCLSRVGKDVYMEFDPLEGLALRSLNDAKSAYACFRFEPSFFERCTSPPSQPRASGRNRRRSQHSRKRSVNHDSDSDDDNEWRFSCRVALRALAAVVRPRKHVASLAITSRVTHSALFLHFEFNIQAPPNTTWRVTHRVPVADANGVSAVSSKDDASELVASPQTLLRLLDPLKNTLEAAFWIRNQERLVAATSFHPTDSASSNAPNNAILQAAASTFLKTETGIRVDELDEFEFRDDRAIADNMPDYVNDKAVLVFPLKETRAFLSYCKTATGSNFSDEPLHVSVWFHWGGKPFTMETKTTSFSAQLVLATLDYSLLGPLEDNSASIENDNSSGRATSVADKE